MEDNIERIKDELEEARQSLHETVTEVNRKVETVSAQLQPARLVGATRCCHYASLARWASHRVIVAIHRCPSWFWVDCSEQR
jgi:hypothetical protein